MQARARMPIHHGRSPNTHRRRDDRDDFMDRGGQPDGSTHYYADRTDRGRAANQAPHGYGFENDEPFNERRMHGPHYGKGPQNFKRSDERLKELVCEALWQDDQIDASALTVEVSQSEVTLAGIVDDRATKRMAEDCAASIAGIRDVHNQLRVRNG